MNDKLKEAVTQAQDLVSDMCLPTPDHIDAIKVLLDFATRVLKAEMPIKNEDIPSSEVEEDSPEYNRAIGWNKCHDDFTLYLTKKCGELEGVIIRFCDDYYDNKPNDVKVIVHDAFKPLAHTLQSYLLGEKGEK